MIAAGSFRVGVTNNPATLVARWDGVAWQQFGAPPPVAPNGYGASAAVYKGKLVIAGFLPPSGGTFTNQVLMWNGTDWSSVGLGPNIIVRPMMAVFDGRLIVSGVTSAGGVPMNGIGSWDGSAWSPLGAGYTGAVLSMQPHAGRLYVGGNIFTAGGQPASHIASWDGQNWSTMNGGVNAAVNQLGTLGREPIVNCTFTTAGGLTAQRWARWGCSCYSNCDNSTAPPILNVNDFLCFLNQFAAGCS